MTKFRWLVPLAILFPLRSYAADNPRGHVATLLIQPGVVSVLHLRPEFESVIHLPEQVSSVVVGSPGSFKVEHSDSEAEYVFVKPIVRTRAESDLVIATKSGQRIVLDLISDGDSAGTSQPVDFLLDYKPRSSFLIVSDALGPEDKGGESNRGSSDSPLSASRGDLSAIDEELNLQKRINAPSWQRWKDQQIEMSLGDIRQMGNQTLISFSILNPSGTAVEIVPPQIQVTGLKPGKKKSKSIRSDQLEIWDYRLSSTRLEPGERVDGVVLFDRPNFKQSTEKLFLQVAQADQVDRPVLLRIPFTPPIATAQR